MIRFQIPVLSIFVFLSANWFFAISLAAMNKVQVYYYACEPCRKLHAACDGQQVCGTCLVKGTEDQCYRATRKIPVKRKKKVETNRCLDNTPGCDYFQKICPDNIDCNLIESSNLCTEDSQNINTTITLYTEEFHKDCWADYFAKKMVHRFENTYYFSNETTQSPSLDSPLAASTFNVSYESTRYKTEPSDNTMPYQHTTECIGHLLPVNMEQGSEHWLDIILKEEPQH